MHQRGLMIESSASLVLVVTSPDLLLSSDVALDAPAQLGKIDKLSALNFHRQCRSQYLVALRFPPFGHSISSHSGDSSPGLAQLSQLEGKASKIIGVYRKSPTTNCTWGASGPLRGRIARRWLRMQSSGELLEQQLLVGIDFS